VKMSLQKEVQSAVLVRFSLFRVWSRSICIVLQLTF